MNTETPKRGRGVRIDEASKQAILVDLLANRDKRSIAAKYNVSLPTVYKLAKTDTVANRVKLAKEEAAQTKNAEQPDPLKETVQEILTPTE